MRSGSDAGEGLRLEDVLALTSQLEVRPLLSEILEVTTRIPGAGSAALELMGTDGDPIETLGSAQPGEIAASAVIFSGDQTFARLEVWSETDEPLTDTAQEEFSELARVAEVAVGNARAYAASERRRDWVQATAELAETLHPPVRMEETMAAVAAGVRRVVRGTFAAVLVRGDGEYDVPAFDGRRPADRSGLIDRLGPQLTAALEDGTLACAPHGEKGTAAFLPIDSERVPGLVVLLVHEAGRGRLVPYVQGLLSSFADQAALAVDRAGLLQERQDAVVRADRERIGRDLHDGVVQRLFATGMRLQSTRHEEDPAGAREHVEAAVEELEMTIRHIRTTIYELQHGRESSLRLELLKLAREFAPALGWTPEVRTWGPVDSLVSVRLADHATVVVREALSNVARHASADRCVVEVHVDEGVLALVVEDDGFGLPSEVHESGLSNLRRRAADLGGTLSLEPVEQVEPRGTRLTWRVPLEP